MAHRIPIPEEVMMLVDQALDPNTPDQEELVNPSYDHEKEEEAAIKVLEERISPAD